MTEQMQGELEGLQQEQSLYNIAVVGRHVLVTEAMKKYATDKIHKMDRISDRIIDVTVTMDIQKLEHRLSIVMFVGNVKIKVQAITEDMYASIDLAVDKLQAKLRKYKKRIQEHQAKPLHSVDMQVNVLRAPDPIEEVNEAIEEENQRQLESDFFPTEVVRKTSTPLKTLTFGEALMKFELSDEPFLLYRSEETQKIKVVYHLEGGEIALLELE